jgi:hypothetical protein
MLCDAKITPAAVMNRADARMKTEVITAPVAAQLCRKAIAPPSATIVTATGNADFGKIQTTIMTKGSIRKGQTMRTIYTVNRPTWFRGAGPQESRLLISQQHMKKSVGKSCCLGHIGLQCGIDPKNMEDIGLPSGITGELPKDYDQWFVRHEDGTNCASRLAQDMADVNDATYMTEEEREQKLKDLAAPFFNIEFIN